MTTPADVMKMAKENGVKIVDFRFCDLLGTWQHTSKSISDVDEEIFEHGVGFDGSSIRGFQSIDASDMLMMPDPTTARLDPYTAVPTMYSSATSTTRPPASATTATRAASPSGPRRTSRPPASATPPTWVRSRSSSSSTTSASTSPTTPASTTIDSIEGYWNSGSENGHGNRGYTIRPKAGYFPVAPHDTLQDIRTEMVLTLEELGIPVEVHHHEVGTAGQCEIDMRFDSLLAIADKVMTYKYVVRNTARKHGKVATFMPKPIFADNGSGMHVHQSIWKDGKNLFVRSQAAMPASARPRMHYIGGLLKHGPALMALAAPTVNSYRRLVPGLRGARQPGLLGAEPLGRGPNPDLLLQPEEQAARVPLRRHGREPVPALRGAADGRAGRDQEQDRSGRRRPSSTSSRPTRRRWPRSRPCRVRCARCWPRSRPITTSCSKASVFTKGFIENWIEYKLENEVEPANLRISPYEFYLYFDV